MYSPSEFCVIKVALDHCPTKSASSPLDVLCRSSEVMSAGSAMRSVPLIIESGAASSCIPVDVTGAQAATNATKSNAAKTISNLFAIVLLLMIVLILLFQLM